MEHLSPEHLARLVNEPSSETESRHLAECEACSNELVALRDQTEALAALPEIVPPKGDWKVVEAQLRSEGLVTDLGLFQKLGMAKTPAWMPAAAAIVLFLGGTATGAGVASRHGAEAIPVDRVAENVEDAASAVRVAEEEYITAVSQYRELLAREGGGELVGDPISRYAALEHLVSVSQAAVRQAPGDPFLNGFLASALAERDAAARMVTVGAEDWF